MSTTTVDKPKTEEKPEEKHEAPRRQPKPALVPPERLKRGNTIFNPGVDKDGPGDDVSDFKSY